MTPAGFPKPRVRLTFILRGAQRAKQRLRREPGSASSFVNFQPQSYVKSLLPKPGNYLNKLQPYGERQ